MYSARGKHISGMQTYPVAIVKQEPPTYPLNPPFTPQAIFPETPIKTQTDEQNHVYNSVRQLFFLLEYDSLNYGKENWNPLGWLIKPGETVFIKPNMISHKHYHCEDWDYVITHGSVIRAVVDYVCIALKGNGKIIIGDSPQTDSNYEKIVERMGLIQIQDLYRVKRNLTIELMDLRDEFLVDESGVYVDKKQLPGDPNGTVRVNMSGQSMFAELDGQSKKYYGAYYDIEETNHHHCDGKHEYLLAKSPLLADVFINIPKLKTHKKCGLTVNLKGSVGITAQKNWLPHYSFGPPAMGGDQFPYSNVKNIMENGLVLTTKRLLMKGNPLIRSFAAKSRSIAYRIFGYTDQVVRSGNWYGNDTVWRMSLDLTRILLYANPDGKMRTEVNPKKYFSFVDGIIGMEGNGPVAGKRKASGVLVAGGNPIAVDTVCAKLMGFDFSRIPLIARSYEKHRYPLIKNFCEAIRPKSNFVGWSKILDAWSYKDLLLFNPPFGWIGKVEEEHHR